MSASTLTKLLAKIDHYDKDERYMCLSDMTTELNKLPGDRSLDSAIERNVVSGLLLRLEKDTSNDVQAIAVKCLSVLVKRITDASVSEICTKLSGAVLRGPVELRDVYAIGVRAVITESPANQSIAHAIVSSLLPPLLSGIAGRVDGGNRAGASASSSSDPSGNRDVRLDCMDLAQELVKRFGATAPCEAQHGALLGAFHAMLADTSAALRKRGTAALGVLSPYLSDSLMDQLITALLASVEGGGGSAGLAKAGGAAKAKGAVVGASEVDTKVAVQALGAVVRAVGQRLGRHAGRVVPILLVQLGDSSQAAQDESANSDAANDLRETVLAALESFIGGGASGPRATVSASPMSPFLPSVLPAALGWLRFDPNYMYGDEDEARDGGDEAMGVSEEEDSEEWGVDQEDDDGAYGDGGDDSSWKSRRASARVISAVFSAAGSGALRPVAGSPTLSLVAELVTALGTPLTRRFKEREESVRLENVVAAHAALVACHTVLGRGQDMEAHGVSGSSPPRCMVQVHATTGGAPSSRSWESRSPSDEAVTAALVKWVPHLLGACLALLRTKGVAYMKTRMAALGLLRGALAVLDLDVKPSPSASSTAVTALLVPMLPVLVSSIMAAMGEKSGSSAATLRLDACNTLHSLLLSFSSAADAVALAPHATHLMAAACTAIGDEYYRTQAAALRLAGTLITLLRPADAANPATALAPPIIAGPAFALAASSCCAVLQPRLAAHDIDIDIKEAAVGAAAPLLCHAGDVPAVAAVEVVLVRILAERARSDTTRVPALRALAYVGCSPLRLDMSAPIAALLPDFASFLRSASRPVRVQACATLGALISSQGAHLVPYVSALAGPLAEVASPLIMSDSDLQLTSLGLGVATAVATTLPAPLASSLLAGSGMPAQVTALACSPLLAAAGSGAASSVPAFLQAAMRAGLTGPLAMRPMMAALVAGAAGSARGVNAGGNGSGTLVPAGMLMAAKSIASLIASNPTEDRHGSVLCVVADATGMPGGGFPDSSSSGLVSAPMLARLVLAELGRLMDVQSTIPAAVSALIGSTCAPAGDDMRTAAALALGGVVAGNMGTGLPPLLAALQQAAGALSITVSVEAGAAGSSSSAAGPAAIGTVVGLLQALREALGRHAMSDSRAGAPDVRDVLPLLFSAWVSGCEHEAVRSLAADCAGKCAAIDPANTLPVLASAASSTTIAQTSHVPSVAVSAVKHALPMCSTTVAGTMARGMELEAALRAAIPSILGPALSAPLLPGGGDHSVYQAALSSLAAAAFSFPSLLVNSPSWTAVPSARFSGMIKAAGLFVDSASSVPAPAAVPATSEAPLSDPATFVRDGYLGILTFAAFPRPELVRTVDLGPFKHRVDEGAPSRKTALAALDAIVERAPASVSRVLSPDENGLAAGGPLAGMSALLPVLLLSAQDKDVDIVMLAHGVLVRTCSAGLLPRLLPSVPAADALADALALALKESVKPAAAAAAGGEPEGSPQSSETGSDAVRTALRVLDAVARALPDAMSASRKLGDLYHTASKSESTHALFAQVRNEGALIAAAGGR